MLKWLFLAAAVSSTAAFVFGLISNGANGANYSMINNAILWLIMSRYATQDKKLESKNAG